MALTHHAKVRMQQRGIPFLAIELLCRFGQSERSGDASIRYFNRKGLKKARQQLQKLADRIDQLENMYCVETSEGVIITTGHRTKPIRRDIKMRSNPKLN